MSSYDIGLVERQLEAYDREIEQWRQDHDAAMQCRDFELLLKLGIDVYETLGRIDTAVSAAALRGERGEADLVAVDDLYRIWLSLAEAVERRLDEFEQAGFRVEFAETFRTARREVQGVLTPDADFFRDDNLADVRLADVRDAAIDSHRRGETDDLIDVEGSRGRPD